MFATRVERRILRTSYERVLDSSLQVPGIAARRYVFIDISFDLPLDVRRKTQTWKMHPSHLKWG
jgi:hypothetical protein